VPKGSFYNYFDGKDAFGVVQLDVDLKRSDLSATEALRAYLDSLMAELERRDF